MAKERRRRTAEPDNVKLAKALNHPTRTEILAALNDQIASPSELAEVLGIDLPNVSYHMNELRKYGLVEPVKREQVRGALKTKFKATQRMLIETDHFAGLTKESQNAICANAVTETIDRVTDAINKGTFANRGDVAVINLKLDADQQLWEEAQAILRDAYERISEAEAQSANRQMSDTFRLTVSLLAYESPAPTA